MKRNKEEYVRQFDFDNIVEKPKIKNDICRMCGKQTVSLYEGVCFECRQQNNTTKYIGLNNEGEFLEWQKKEIIHSICSLVVFALLALGVLLSLIYVTITRGATKFTPIFITVFCIFSLLVWVSCKVLIENIHKYKDSKKLIPKIQAINTFKTHQQIVVAFNAQKHYKYYEGENFIITEDFFATSKEDMVLVLDCILDVKIIIHKVNSVSDYVKLNILYYDGKNYEFKLKKTIGEFTIQKKLQEVETVASIISNKSKNFRKYPSFRF